MRCETCAGTGTLVMERWGWRDPALRCEYRTVCSDCDGSGEMATYRQIETALNGLEHTVRMTGYEFCQVEEIGSGRQVEDWTQALHELRRAGERLAAARRLLGVE